MGGGAREQRLEWIRGKVAGGPLRRASLDLAQLAHEANDDEGLAKYVGESKAVACVGANSGDRYNDSELEERCLRTALMEGWVTGTNQALMRKISEQNDERMRAVVEALRKKD